jgi:hypothetical protein
MIMCSQSGIWNTVDYKLPGATDFLISFFLFREVTLTFPSLSSALHATMSSNERCSNELTGDTTSDLDRLLDRFRAATIRQRIA